MELNNKIITFRQNLLILERELDSMESKGEGVPAEIRKCRGFVQVLRFKVQEIMRSGDSLEVKTRTYQGCVNNLTYISGLISEMKF